MRTYSIYTPPGFDGKSEGDGGGCPLVVLFDGSSYYTDSYIPGHTIIDNLIAAKKIPPIVVAFVNSVDRQKELNCSKDFAGFLAKELVPLVRSQRHTSSEAKRTTVGGVSLGGLMASYCALSHSDVFGNVISQSGAYWYFPGAFDTPTVMVTPGGTLIDEFVKAPKLPVRFYLEAGEFENDIPGDLLAENRRFRDVLLAKGNDVTYSEFSGGHHFISWRGTFSDALIAVTR
jgi:enterochelin esterase family protein